MRTEFQIAHLLDTAKSLPVEAQYQLLEVLESDEIESADLIASSTRVADGHGEMPEPLDAHTTCPICGDVESGNSSLSPAYHPSVLGL